MTLPSLISDYKVKEVVSKIKKVQTTFSQALLMAENEYGPMKNWEIIADDKENAELVGARLKPYLKIIDDCGTGTCESYTAQWNFLNGVSDNNVTNFSSDIYYKMRLSDGSEIFIRTGNDSFTIHLDTNGKKAPNVLGKDIFRFMFINSKLHITGIGANPNTPGWEYCNPKSGQGWHCTAWVLYKENMDYLKCPEVLDWNGQSKCK